MSHFSKDYISFFQELSKNNHKAWFDQNRQRFEQQVKNPFHAFVEEMIVRIHSDDPDVLISPNEAIFRIFRDVRFSNDKTPYKTHMAAVISPGGRKAKNRPGFYFQIGVNGIKLYSGVHDLDKGKLESVRRYIANHLPQLEKIIKNSEFKSRYGEILGEKHKRLPPEFQDLASKQPLIANRVFYVTADMAKSNITNPALSELMMKYYFGVKPFLQLLNHALE